MSPHWAACLRRALWIGSLIALIGLMTTSVRGQDDDTDGTEVVQETQEQLVLLKNGRMLTGQVSRNGGGYLIEQPNGRVQVLKEEVRFVVSDLREAYKKQRDSIVEPTPATHIALANWCISHKLHDEAREELKRCLKTDPENREARRLLQRLTDTIRADLPPKSATAVLLKTSDGFLLPEAESLGGLSKESAALFTSRIQPLLLNKCGNASCHGASSPNNFRLSLARAGRNGSRQITERNLAETLRYLDLNNLASSGILRATNGSHGGKGTIFVGQAGGEQIRQLKEWARTIAREKNADADDQEHLHRHAEKSGPKRRYPKVTQVSSKSEEIIETELDTNLESADGMSATEDIPAKPRELKPDPTDAAALAREPEDAFDPEQFNRRFRR